MTWWIDLHTAGRHRHLMRDGSRRALCGLRIVHPVVAPREGNECRTCARIGAA